MIIDLILKKKVVANFYKSRYKIKEEEVKTLRNRFEEFDRGLRISKKTKTISRKIQRETKEYTINEITNIKSKVKLYIEKGTLNRYSDIRELKKELKYIDDNLYESCNLMKLDSKKLKGLKAVIMDAVRQVGSYLPKTNTLYLNPLILGSEEKYGSTLINELACNDNILSNYMHELTHYLEAKRFWNDKEGRNRLYQNIKKLLKNKDIGKGISEYAKKQYINKEKIGEIIAECLVNRVLGRNKRGQLVNKVIELLKGEKML